MAAVSFSLYVLSRVAGWLQGVGKSGFKFEDSPATEKSLLGIRDYLSRATDV